MQQELRLLFHELVDLSPTEREQVFRERRIGAELRAEVESLLGFDSTNQDLTGRVWHAAGDLLRSASGSDLSYCGQYRLVRQLGSGGMGAVYLAERTDGEIQQQVAVKLLRADERRPAWRGRFLRERQLLASLNHPSIVHVIDAGHTEGGRPYLVMEYVEGTPIDAYAATIDLRDRLRLFLRVCDGVSHAHHHLIIHRDLKPSNILVDPSGQPKLLDFGIAKLLDETGDATQTVERLLTPNYASPEQLIGAPQTTATDIYSLGAVLYKLLTGAVPSDIAPPSRVNPDVPRDLDFIILKALRKEPDERYASVEAFAADIRALLESRPVEARSGNAWYRTRKFLRRYWVPVVATALVIVSLSAGLYVANRQRIIAERRFQQLRQLSNKVFDLDKAIKNLPGSIQARQSLVSASLEYLEGLASYAHGDPDLAREIGEGYWRVGRIQGVPTELNLGDPAKAELTLKRADELFETVLASRPKDRTALLRSAAVAHDRMILAWQEHRNVDALAFAHKSVDRMEEFLRRGDASDTERNDVAGIYSNIALVHVNMHLYEKAIPYARRTVELARPIPSARRQVGFGLSVLASALRYQGDLEAALQAVQEARKIAEETVYADETVRMVTMVGILRSEGLTRGEDGGVNLGQPDEAIKALQRAFDLSEEAARKDPSDALSRVRVGTIGIPLGDIMRHRDPRRALAVYDVTIRRLGEVRNDVTSRRDQAWALANSSYALRSLHQTSEAQKRIDAALAILTETKDYPAERIPSDRSGLYSAHLALADYEAEEGDAHRAVELYEQLLDKVMAGKLEPLTDLRDAPRMSRLYEALAVLYRRTGNIAKAESMEARRLELWRHWDNKLPNNPFIRRQLEAERLP